MPDIVLTDGSGKSDTYAGVNAIGVDTPDGGVALYYSEEILQQTIPHPDSHPASMITGLSKVATTGNYDDLLGRPFGVLDPVLSDRTLIFEEKSGYYSIGFDKDEWLDLIVGETYTVIWDGDEFNCLCKDLLTEVDFISGDKPLPFIGDINNTLEPGSIEALSAPFLILPDGISTVEANSTHVISIIPVSDIHKLDAKYLPDEVATKDFVLEEISKIEVSSGSGSTEVDVFAERDVVFKSDTIIGYPVYASDYIEPGEFKLVDGETYTVVWGNSEFTCEAAAIDYNNMRIVAIGDLTLYGLSGNSEPFVVTYNVTRDGTQFITNDSTKDVHKIRIYQKVEQETVVAIHEMPFFDLYNMGLPTLSNEGFVTLDCDTTPLKEAASKGLMKIAVSIFGIITEVVVAPFYTPINDAYAYTTMVVFNEIPTIIEFGIQSTYVYIKSYVLNTSTST